MKMQRLRYIYKAVCLIEKYSYMWLEPFPENFSWSADGIFPVLAGKRTVHHRELPGAEWSLQG